MAFIGINVTAFISNGIAGFPGIKMILTAFPLPEFIVFSYGNALSRSFMSFYFWHIFILISM